MLWRLWVGLALLMLCFSSLMILQVKLPKDRVIFTERLRISLDEGDYLTSVSWRDDSQIFATTNTQGQIQLWDSATGQELAHLEQGEYMASRLFWQPSGTLLGAELYNKQNPQTWRVVIWDTAQLGASLANYTILLEYDWGILNFQWKPDGAQLAIFTSGNVMIWDVASQKIQHNFPTQCSVSGIGWNPTGTLLGIPSHVICYKVYVVNPDEGSIMSSSVGNGQTLIWLDPDTLIQPLHRCNPCVKDKQSINEVGFQIIYQDGQFLYPYPVKIVDRIPSDNYGGHLSFSLSQDLLIFQHKRIYLWRLSDLQRLSIIPNLHDLWVPISPDGTFLPYITPTDIYILDWQTPNLALSIPNYGSGFFTWRPDSGQVALIVVGELVIWQRREVCAEWPDLLRELLVRQRPWCN